MDNARLCDRNRPVDLPPKTLALLHCLVSQPGRLLSKETLIDTVWRRRYVSESVLKGCINTLRKALGDDPRLPRYIETVTKNGYRFVAEVRQAAPLQAEPDPELVRALLYQPRARAIPVHRVGRYRELSVLEQHWLDALEGQRQLIFIGGEPGIGKSTLIDMFLERFSGHPAGVLATRCVEHYGQGEALMPLLEALEQRCRAAGGDTLLARIRRHAPTCLMQMPALISDEEQKQLKARALGASSQRTLREAVDLLESLSRDLPLVLVIEDAHWSDLATVELLAMLGRRDAPARLLTLISFRPGGMPQRDHPFPQVRQELLIHRLALDLPLAWLGRQQVEDYLRAQLNGGEPEPELVDFVYLRTEGHPLFMVNVVDHLIRQRLLRHEQGRWLPAADEEGAFDSGVPDNLKAMIETQLDRLAPVDRRILETASAIGAEWPAGLVAALLGEPQAELEAACQNLVRRSHVLAAGGTAEAPGGRLEGSYTFRHSLYVDVLYEHLGPAQRMELHRRIGRELEARSRGRLGTVAAELARHFERGRDDAEAIKYLAMAAANASRRYANREAKHYLDRALAMLGKLPRHKRLSRTLELHHQRATVRRAMHDMKGALEDFATVGRIAAAEDQRSWEIKALLEQARVMFWIDRPRCLVLAEEALVRAAALPDEIARFQVLGSCAGWRLNLRGWDPQAVYDCEQALVKVRETGTPEQLNLRMALHASLELYRSRYRVAIAAATEGCAVAQRVGDAQQYMVCQSLSIIALLHLGEWGEARRQIQAALHMAEQNDNDLGKAVFSLELAWLHELAQDFNAARAISDRAVGLLPHPRSPYTSFLGLIRQGMARLEMGDHGGAHSCFSQVERELEAGGGLMYWNMRLMFHHGLARYWLALEDFGQAANEAAALCDLAGQCGERTYHALGRCLLARVALAADRLEEADDQVRQAFALIRDGEVPLAAWQVHALAAELSRRQDRPAEAERQESRAAAILQGLAATLDDADGLRDSLLAHPLCRRDACAAQA
jgi:DNA-binding winged helix-turn-helix (wHTH) protein/tetratricopeptide (TPR) repeat protein